MKERVSISIIILLFIPSVVCARVSISEIAWMGVAGPNGQFGEWIELANDGPVEDLSGWELYSGGGSDIVFTLSKSIPENGYLLIERTTASMSDPVPGVDDEHGSFGSGGLSNDGEHLVLKDAKGVVVEELNYSSGWPAGDVDTKETMQRTGSGWTTALATPKHSFQNGGGGSGETSDDENKDETPTTSFNKKAPPVHHDPFIRLDVPSELYQYVEHTFLADVVLEDGLHHKSGPVRWNMGDGTMIEQRSLEPLTHRYRYPGTYTIWLGFYRSYFDTEPLLVTTKVVRVGTPVLSIVKIDATAVEITNESGSTVDLSLWQVVSGGDRVSLPAHTFLAPDASIVIDTAKLGLVLGREVSLARPQGEILERTLPTVLRDYTEQVRDTPPVSQDGGLVESEIQARDILAQVPKTNNRTREIVFGAIATILVALFILLERFMAKRE